MQFFFEGDELFSALEAETNSAKNHIDLEMYIFASDAIGWRFAELLARKAYSGVRVRVHYDSIGCDMTDSGLWGLLEENGVQLKEYNPFFPLPRKLHRRNHRKMLLVDGRVGFLGGFNLMQENSRRIVGNKCWRDTGVRLDREDLIQEMARLFELAWDGKNLQIRELTHRQRRSSQKAPNGIRIVPSYGMRRLSFIRDAYLRAIRSSQQRVWITNSYFVPDLGILRTLKKAAERGVDVRILTAGVSDVSIARFAGHAVYSTLLKSGTKLFEFQSRVLHAKSAVVDKDWFTVGSSNIDHLSFFHNLEVNLVGRDFAATKVVADQFSKDLQSAKEIKLEDWQMRSKWSRLREQLCYAFRAWL